MGQSVRSDRCGRVWDASSRRESERYNRHPVPAWAVAILPGGDHAPVGGGERSLCEWDLTTGKQVRELKNVLEEGQAGQ